MNDNENRRLQMFARVRDFRMSRPNEFAPTSLGLQHFNALEEVINELNGFAAAEASGRGQARLGTETRAQARAALREDLEAISRTARAMETEIPGLEDKFEPPRADNDQLLLNAARAFKTDATPLQAQFVAHELPADFLSDLETDIDAFEAAITAQTFGVGDHVAARAAIDDSISKGMDLVRKLDAIVRNKYSNNPAALAEWTSASHTERAPRRSASAAPPPPTPTPPSP